MCLSMTENDRALEAWRALYNIRVDSLREAYERVSTERRFSLLQHLEDLETGMGARTLTTRRGAQAYREEYVETALREDYGKDAERILEVYSHADPRDLTVFVRQKLRKNNITQIRFATTLGIPLPTVKNLLSRAGKGKKIKSVNFAPIIKWAIDMGYDPVSKK